jgi:hypothetical protein
MLCAVKRKLLMQEFFYKIYNPFRGLFKKLFSHAIDSIFPWLLHFLLVSKEFIITIIFSLSPILLSALVQATWSDDGYIDSFKSNFKSGEVFIYTAAFLAPYIVNRLGDGVKGLFKELLFYVFFIVLLAGAFLFITLRIEAVIGQNMKISEQTLNYVSYSVVIFTSFIWYYSIWPNHRLALRDIQRKSAEEMQKLNDELNKKLGG